MTQEYTPVTWQDETTSQQGTLINAERLNQMQTAHHFADGFEEVDAVPTADPGVSYHKVVYCTADSTFYRWDGTEWSADIDDDTKRLLEQEISRATEAEGELAQDIADEETRATAAETALGNRVTAETSARTAADTTLGGRIDAEATSREEADTELGADIGAETARARQAEQANAGAIATHVADRQNPHEVTKAQVGLGNADNTADLDKPISTATQAALDEKASTGTVATLAGRVDTLETGLADTYNKSQVDTYLAAKADDSAVVHKAGAETIPGAKTFSAVTNMFAINYDRTGGYLEQCTISTEERGTIPVSQIQIQPLTINDKNSQQLYFEQYITGTDGARRFRKNLYTTQNTRVQIEDFWVKPDGTGWRGSPILPDDAPSNALTPINWVSQTGDSAPNNLVHRSGDESFTGIKNAITGIEGKIYYRGINTSTSSDIVWAKGFSLTLADNQMIIVDIVSAFNNGDTQNATVKIYRRDSDNTLGCVVINSSGTISTMASASNYVATLDGSTVTLYTKKIRRYTNLRARVWWAGSYGNMIDLPTITWLNTPSDDPTTETHDRITVGSIVEYHNVA